MASRSEDDGNVSSEVVSALLALEDEWGEAEATQRPWPGERHAALLGSPQFGEFLTAIETVEVLRPLVLGAGLRVDSDFGGYEVAPAGGTWLVMQLLQDGRRLAAEQSRTDREASRENLERALNGVLTSLRTGTSTLRSYAGIRGLSVADSDEADVGIGHLRRLQPAELRALSFDAAIGSPTTDELCLVSEGTARWRLVERPDPRRRSTPQPPSAVALLPVLMVLAGALDHQGHLRAPHIAWTRTSPYFFMGGTLSGGANPGVSWQTSDFFSADVTAAVAATAREVAPGLAAALPGALGIATRRLVSAALVFDRTPEDRLVDASIAWESLFGSRTSDQLSLQLALSSAWILHPTDPDARRKVFNRAKKIYGLRSRIVHGGSAKTTDVEAAAEELLVWLRQTLLVLLTTHKSLLSVEDRLQQLALQAFESEAPSGA